MSKRDVQVPADVRQLGWENTPDATRDLDGAHERFWVGQLKAVVGPDLDTKNEDYVLNH